MLNLETDVNVVEVERAADLVPTLARTPCDLLLLDLQMERSPLADIGSVSRAVAAVVVTTSERPEDAMAAIRAGARGVVFKGHALETLMDAMRAVANGLV